MLDHPKIHCARQDIDTTDNLHTGQDSNILAMIHGGAGAKEPRDAEPARAKADELRILYLLPPLGCLKFLPRVQDLWLGLGIHGGEVSGSQQVLVLGSEAKPELELGNVVNLASEGQRPLAHFTPRFVLAVGGGVRHDAVGAGVAHRVQAVAAVTVYGYADLRARFDNSVGADF